MGKQARKPEDIERDIDKLDWESNEPIKTLTRLYELTVERAQSELQWYEDHIPRTRNFSYLLRGLSILFLSLGIIAPLLIIPDGKGVDISQQLRLNYLGYASLAIAGILFSIDRFFLASKAWIRYISAEMFIAQKLADFRYTWQKHLVTLKGTSLTVDKQVSIISDFQTFTSEILNEVFKETGIWRTDFEESLKALGDKLGSTSQELKTQLLELQESERKKREEEKAKKVGFIEVVLISTENKGDIRISLDSQISKVLQHPSNVWSFGDLQPAIHNVTVTGETKEGKKFELAKPVEVKSGEISKVDFSIP